MRTALCLLSSLFMLWIIFMFAGCARAAPEPEIRYLTKEVQVPITQPCPAQVAPDPRYVDTERAIRDAENIYNRALLFTAGRLQRIDRERELRGALVDVCGVVIPAQ